MPWDVISKNLGFSEGGVVRQGFDALLAALGFGANPAAPVHQSTTFTIAFIALAAKMAKADGCVSPIEAATFAKLYQVPPDEEANVKRVFDLAAGDTAGFDIYARQIALALSNEPRLLRDVFDGLFHIAAADGILHPAEDTYLRRVAEIFGIPTREFVQIRSAFIHDGRLSASQDSHAIARQYQVLGLDPQASDADLKARYRALVREHHPDSLAARGIPPEYVAASERKLAVINAAFDSIQRARGLREAVLPNVHSP